MKAKIVKSKNREKPYEVIRVSRMGRYNDYGRKYGEKGIAMVYRDSDLELRCEPSELENEIKNHVNKYFQKTKK